MNTLEKEFVPYQESLELKEIGFNEPCFYWYTALGHFVNAGKSNQPPLDYACSAPTFSQAFRWFREKYSLHAEITWSPSYEYEPGKWADAIYEITITNVSYTKKWVAESPSMQRANGKQLTYEEAELACLRKLIEIVKQNDKSS